MIESIIVKNKKGDQIELTLEELQELKDELNGLDQVQTQPWPTFYPTISKDREDFTNWPLPQTWCKTANVNICPEINKTLASASGK